MWQAYTARIRQRLLQSMDDGQCFPTDVPLSFLLIDNIWAGVPFYLGAPSGSLWIMPYNYGYKTTTTIQLSKSWKSRTAQSAKQIFHAYLVRVQSCNQEQMQSLSGEHFLARLIVALIVVYLKWKRIDKHTLLVPLTHSDRYLSRRLIVVGDTPQ